MKGKKLTPDHIKEIRVIRRKLSQAYLRNPLRFLGQMSQKAKVWRQDHSKQAA